MADMDFSDLASQQDQPKMTFADLAPSQGGQGNSMTFADLAPKQSDNHSFFWDTMGRLSDWANSDNPQKQAEARQRQQQARQYLESPTQTKSASDFFNTTIPKSVVNTAIGAVNMPDEIPNQGIGQNLKSFADYLGMPIGMGPDGHISWGQFKDNWINHPVETATALLPWAHGILRARGVEAPTDTQATELIHQTVADFDKYYEGQNQPVVSGRSPLTQSQNGMVARLPEPLPDMSNDPFDYRANLKNYSDHDLRMMGLDDNGIKIIRNGGIPPTVDQTTPHPQTSDLASQMTFQDLVDSVPQNERQSPYVPIPGSYQGFGEITKPTIQGPMGSPSPSSLAADVTHQDYVDQARQDLANRPQGLVAPNPGSYRGSGEIVNPTVNGPMGGVNPGSLMTEMSFRDLVDTAQPKGAESPAPIPFQESNPVNTVPTEAQRIMDLANEAKARKQASITPDPTTGLSPMANQIADVLGGKESGGKYDIQENGGGPSYGKYQYLPETWARTSEAFARANGIGDGPLPATPAYQEAVTRWQVQRYLDQGYSPDQIASLWNSGRPDPTGLVGVNKYGKAYDAPAYVQDFHNKLAALQDAMGSSNPGDLMQKVRSMGDQGIFTMDQLKGIYQDLNDNLGRQIEDPEAFARKMLEDAGISDPTKITEQGSPTQVVSDNTQNAMDSIANKDGGFVTPERAQQVIDSMNKRLGEDDQLPPARIVPNGDGSYKVNWLTPLSNERGAIAPDFLSAPAAFIQKSVIPTLGSATDWASRAMDGLRGFFDPTSASDNAAKTGMEVRGLAGERARSNQVAQASLKGIHDYFDQLNAQTGDQAGIDWIDKAQRGIASTDPMLETFRQLEIEGFQARRDAIHNIDPEIMPEDKMIEHYFPNLWEDPNQGAKFSSDFLGKRNLEGSKDFMKNRSLQYFKEGLSYRVYDPEGNYTGQYFPDEATAQRVAASMTTPDGFAGSVAPPLKPMSANPVDFVLTRFAQMDKFIMALKLKDFLQENEWWNVQPSMKAGPDGWSMLDDKMSQIMIPNNGTLNYVAKVWVPDDVAKVINNYLSPGLRGNMLFDSYMGLANNMNMAQLALSGFHALAQTIYSSALDVGLGIKQGLAGDFSEAGKNIGRGLIPGASAYDNFVKGRVGRSEYFAPGSQGEELGNLINLGADAGWRGKMDQFYATNWWDRAKAAFADDNPILGGLNVAGNLATYTSRKIMEDLVPNIKMGAAMKAAEWELGRMRTEAAATGVPIDDWAVRSKFGEIWDNVENLCGQLTYDNLFWNKTAKDIGLASVRALGWDLGTVRGVGGGVADLMGNTKDILTGEKPELSHRSASLMGLTATTMLTGALIHYLNTGQGPQELKDYFFPKTGQTDEAGREARLSLPTIMKDVYQFAAAPVSLQGARDRLQMLANKANPLIQYATQLWENQNFYGVQIYDPHATGLDGLLQNLGEVANFTKNSVMPFSLQSLNREKQLAGPEPTVSQHPMFGLNLAPTSVTMSDAEKLARSYSPPSPAITQEQYDQRQLLNHLRAIGRSGRPLTQDEMGQLNTLTTKAITRAVTEGGSSPLDSLFKRNLTPDQAGDVLQQATPEERKTLIPLYVEKLAHAQANQTPEQFQKTLEKARGIVQSLKQ